MNDKIKHLLGLCGEHTHPNIVNITLVIIGLTLMIRYFYKRKSAK